jgi:hypothetical protein
MMTSARTTGNTWEFCIYSHVHSHKILKSAEIKYLSWSLASKPFNRGMSMQQISNVRSSVLSINTLSTSTRTWSTSIDSSQLE